MKKQDLIFIPILFVALFAAIGFALSMRWLFAPILGVSQPPATATSEGYSVFFPLGASGPVCDSRDEIDMSGCVQQLQSLIPTTTPALDSSSSTLTIGSSFIPPDILDVYGVSHTLELSVASSGIVYINKDCVSSIPVTKQSCEDAISKSLAPYFPNTPSSSANICPAIDGSLLNGETITCHDGELTGNETTSSSVTMGEVKTWSCDL